MAMSIRRISSSRLSPERHAPAGAHESELGRQRGRRLAGGQTDQLEQRRPWSSTGGPAPNVLSSRAIASR
jgi:hypothetical protein